LDHLSKDNKTIIDSVTVAGLFRQELIAISAICEK
jgi:hypothetical protein